MKKTASQSRAKLVQIIEAAPINTRIDLESIGHILKWVSFSLEDGEYEWMAERSWKNNRSVGYVHPMKNSQYVKTFKTLAGAKRSFIKIWSGEWSFVREAQ